jgi:hypothetical protein
LASPTTVYEFVDPARPPPWCTARWPSDCVRVITPDWMLLVSLVFTRPGHYHLYVLKVGYLEGGLRYWDDVRADISVQAISPRVDPRIVEPRPC